MSVVTVGDIDGDGRSEFLFGNLDGAFLLLSSDLDDLDAADGTVDGRIDIASAVTALGSGGYIFEEGPDVASLGGALSAGDVDGDGVGDILIGASTSGANGSTRGEAWLMFGSDLGLADAADGTLDGVITLDDAPAARPGGFVGYRIVGSTGGQEAGLDVSLAGDVDGDGLSDLLIGTYSNAGAFLLLAADLADLDAADGATDGVIDLGNTTSLIEPNSVPTFEYSVWAVDYDTDQISIDLAALGNDAGDGADGTTLTYEVTAVSGPGTTTIIGTTLIFEPGDAYADLAIGFHEDITITITATDADGATVTGEVGLRIEGPAIEGPIVTGYRIPDHRRRGGRHAGVGGRPCW